MKIDQFVDLVCEVALKQTGMSVLEDLEFSPHDYFDSGAGTEDQVGHATEAVLRFAETNGLPVAEYWCEGPVSRAEHLQDLSSVVLQMFREKDE